MSLLIFNSPSITEFSSPQSLPLDHIQKLMKEIHRGDSVGSSERVQAVCEPLCTGAKSTLNSEPRHAGVDENFNLLIIIAQIMCSDLQNLFF